MYDVSIDIQEDGTVFVAGVDGRKTDEAVRNIETLAKGPELGQIYTGKVVRVTDFGAFVEILPGTDGMVHISQLSADHLKRVEDAVRLGDEVMVMITDVTGDGKIRLSRKAVLEGMTLAEAQADDRPGGGSRGGSRGGNRGGGNRRRN
jgi:polyribonucleotide nucleotidyltransferase